MLPRHRNNGALDSLLGDRGRRGGDHQVRSLLLEAHKQDSELLTHIGEDIERTRRQIRRAISVLLAYRDGTSGSFPCAHALATLLVRLMVRGDYEPSSGDPTAIATGLAAVSADSLAAFAAEDSDEFEVAGWEIDQLRGPLNNDPSAGCERAANELVRLLNETCPRAISPEEAGRRYRVRKVLDRSRNFNDDTAAAEERWLTIYTRHLPRALAKNSPAAIVESYMDGAERNSDDETGR